MAPQPRTRPPATADRLVAIEQPLADWLRGRVGALRASTRRRVFPAVVELVRQRPGPDAAPLRAWTYGAERTDHALRVDVLVRLLTGCSTPVALVHVRPGDHEPDDADLGWAAAGRVAAVIAGADVRATVAVGRWGWADVASGQRRTWKRLRTR